MKSKWIYTVNENNNDAPKILFKFWCSIKLLMFNFYLLTPYLFCSSNFSIAKLSLLISMLNFLSIFNFISLLFFLFSSIERYRSSNYCNSNSCRSFRPLNSEELSKCPMLLSQKIWQLNNVVAPKLFH